MSEQKNFSTAGDYNPTPALCYVPTGRFVIVSTASGLSRGKDYLMIPAMKRCALAVLLIAAFAGCAKPRPDAIRAAFPGAELQAVPFHETEFIVRKPDGSIHYVYYVAPRGNVDSVELFKAKP